MQGGVLNFQVYFLYILVLPIVLTFCRTCLSVNHKRISKRGMDHDNARCLLLSLTNSFVNPDCVNSTIVSSLLVT